MDKARFEFRIFAPYDGVPDKLLTFTHYFGAPVFQQSADTYFLTRGQADLNVKIRDGRLSIKSRVECRSGFERWRSLGIVDFPLTSEWDDFLRQRCHYPDALLATATDPRSFVDAAERSSTVFVAHTRKHRWKFQLGRLSGEVARVAVNGAAFSSSLLESADLETITAAMANVGLEGQTNLSFPAMLQQSLGLMALPHSVTQRLDPDTSSR